MLDAPARKTIEVSVDAALLDEAEALQIDISKAGAEGIAEAIRQRRNEMWLAENLEAIEQNNRYFEENGLPFSEYRGF